MSCSNPLICLGAQLPKMLRNDYRPCLTKERRREENRLFSIVVAGAALMKGNRRRRGDWIYHLPDMPYCNETRAEEMFCTEAEAIAAGYRRSRAQ